MVAIRKRRGRRVVLGGVGASFVFTCVAGLDCWSGSYTADMCCDLKFGPRGNPSCWSGPYSFDVCCKGSQTKSRSSKDAGTSRSHAVARKQESIDGIVVGIDLGTTYSAVAIFRNGRAEVIPNDQGNRITPSVVALLESGERVVGEAAKHMLSERPRSTVYDVKRLIGRGFDDRSVQADRKTFPFAVVDKGGRPHVRLEGANGAKVVLAPEEVSGLVLAKMKASAEAFLGVEVRHAVVTVPAYFDDNQRSATRSAGEIAGLTVARVLSEPTAAAMAYGLDRQRELALVGSKAPDSRVLVYDLGGGTFDVSLLGLSEETGVFETIATCGDTHLGGEDFDRNVVDHLAKRFKEKTGKDPSSDRRAMQRLRLATESAKRTLSTDVKTTLEIEDLFQGRDLRDSLSRAQFERLNGALFDRTLEPIKRVLSDAGLSERDVTDVVMVGGSTRIPKIQRLLQTFFALPELPRHQVSPDEAVAVGAAIQGEILWRGSPQGHAVEGSWGGWARGLTSWLGGQERKQVILIDVTPLSLGVEIHGGHMVVLVARNSALPTQKARTFSTVQDKQTSVYIPVYQGESKVASDNSKLGEMVLSGIPPAPIGVPQIVVTFHINADGILHVSAEEQGTGKSASVSLNARKGRMPEDELSKMKKSAQRRAEVDQALVVRRDAEDSLKTYLESLRASVLTESLGREERSKLEKAVRSAESWLQKKRGATADDVQERRLLVESAAAGAVSQVFPLGDGSEGEDTRLDEL